MTTIPSGKRISDTSITLYPKEPLPLVSVILPAYNGRDYIAATLKSLASQDYTALEILIIDDYSRDDSGAVVETFLRENPLPARFIRHTENQGLARSLNHGLRLATGKYVLIIHQDIRLLSPNWISQAVADARQDPTIAVVTGDYGIPSLNEIDFIQRIFGVLRRQIHAGSLEGREYVTFSEFKCDVALREALQEADGFSERFRIAGEDIWVSYTLRSRGWRILKDFGLPCVQRFTGDATSLKGNLRKEYLFGKTIAGTLLHFRSFATANLGETGYSRSRSWNRASQPLFLLGGLTLLVLTLLTRDWWFLYALLLFVGARLVYHGYRLAPDMTRLVSPWRRAVLETLAGSPIGILSDLAYSFGIATGMFRWALGWTV